MPIDETQICNMAILKTGSKVLISSLATDPSDNAILCRQFYGSVLDAVLRSHPWNCAIHRKTITPIAETPDSDWDYQYQLPANPWCLRVLQVGAAENQPIEWRVEGRRLLTNEASPPIVYVKRITDTNEFDSLLVDAFTLKLALKLAMPLAANAKILKGLVDELETISLPEARSVDGQESSVRQIQTDTWIESRF